MAEHVNSLQDLSVYHYCSELDQLAIEDENQRTPEVIEMSATVRTLYNAGAPLFTKDGLCAIFSQLTRNTDQVYVRTIDGQLVPFKRRTGESLDPDDESEYSWLIGEPFMTFCSIQEVLTNIQQYPSPLSLCSVWIYHNSPRQSKATGEIWRPVSSQSKDKIAQFFQSNREAWEACEQCGHLRRTISNVTNLQVTKIIAFACGGMSFNDRVAWTVNSAYQHALILTIKDVMSAHRDSINEIECYVQDPIYDDLDREVLALHNIRTLHSPEGFLEVDNSTVVLSFSPDIPVRQIIADLAQPAIMIWDQCQSMADDIEESNRTDPDSPRLTAMLNKFYIEFDVLSGIPAFKNISIYIRKHS